MDTWVFQCEAIMNRAAMHILGDVIWWTDVHGMCVSLYEHVGYFSRSRFSEL